MFTYSKIYYDEFSGNSAIREKIVFEGCSVEFFKEEYEQSEYNIFNSSWNYSDYDVNDKEVSEGDKSPFFDAGYTGLVVAKFFQIHLVVATFCQVTIYDGREVKAPLKVSQMNTNQFTEKYEKEVPDHARTMYMATDNEQYNLFMCRKCVQSPTTFSSM